MSSGPEQLVGINCCITRRQGIYKEAGGMAGSFVTCLKPRCPANPTAGEGDWSPEAQGAPRAEQELPGILR
jgi:hypothetical protein